MSLPIFFFASGWSFFFGVAIILLAMVMGVRESRRSGSARKRCWGVINRRHCHQCRGNQSSRDRE